MVERTTQKHLDGMFERLVSNTGLQLEMHNGSKLYGNTFQVYKGKNGSIERVLITAWSKTELYEKMNAVNAVIEQMRHEGKGIPE